MACVGSARIFLKGAEGLGQRPYWTTDALTGVLSLFLLSWVVGEELETPKKKTKFSINPKKLPSLMEGSLNEDHVMINGVKDA